MDEDSGPAFNPDCTFARSLEMGKFRSPSMEEFRTPAIKDKGGGLIRIMGWRHDVLSVRLVRPRAWRLFRHLESRNYARSR